MKDKSRWIIPVISYLLAAISFVFGSYDALWNSLGLDTSLRIPLTIGVSILILLIGHFINTLQIDEKIYNEVNEIRRSILQIPNLNILKILDNGDEGINYLNSRIQNARFIRNTRVPVGNTVAYSTKYSKAYYITTKKIIQNKDLVFKDIVSSKNIPLTENFKQISIAFGSKYEYRILENCSKGFLNFMILEDKFNITEVIFGWVTSEVNGYKEKCFVSQDKDLISLFSTIFEELWNNSKEIEK